MGRTELGCTRTERGSERERAIEKERKRERERGRDRQTEREREREKKKARERGRERAYHLDLSHLRDPRWFHCFRGRFRAKKEQFKTF